MSSENSWVRWEGQCQVTLAELGEKCDGVTDGVTDGVMVIADPRDASASKNMLCSFYNSDLN